MTNEEKENLKKEIATLEAELEKRYAIFRKMCEDHHRRYADSDSEISWEMFSSTCDDYCTVHIAPLRDLVEAKKELLKRNATNG